MESPTWAFVWTKGQPYITSIIGWDKKQVMEEARQSMGQTWRQIYAKGGRVLHVNVTLTKP